MKGFLESQIWKAMQKVTNCKEIWRVENRGMVPGMPDCHYNFMGFPGWIELKAEEFGKKVVFQTGQVPWLKNYCERCGYAFILISDGVTVWIFNGHLAGQLGDGMGWDSHLAKFSFKEMKLLRKTIVDLHQ